MGSGSDMFNLFEFDWMHIKNLLEEQKHWDTPHQEPMIDEDQRVLSLLEGPLGIPPPPPIEEEETLMPPPIEEEEETHVPPPLLEEENLAPKQGEEHVA